MPPKRGASKIMPSPRKNSKKSKILSKADATSVMEGTLITSMLVEHTSTFVNMEGYAKDLLDLRSLEEPNPKVILKQLLIEGWMDDQGRISTKEGELNHIWKKIRAYNMAISANLARNIIPELDLTEIEPLEATTVAELVKATNKALKINNEYLKNIADTNNKIHPQ